MSFTISDIYKPLTSAPFRNSDNYREYQPCRELMPYIRCFWSADVKCGTAGPTLVIPDTCTDIIIDVNNENNSTYCGINDIPLVSSYDPERDISTFAIRFYCHSAVLFCEGNMDNSLNRYIPAEELFGDSSRELTRQIMQAKTTAERIKISERFLLQKLDKSRENPAFLNGLYYIIKNSGNVNVEDISSYTVYSKRQLERIFKAVSGVPPKTLAGLIRYQLLWQDVLSGKYNPLDAVEKFGYCDQSHLLNDFRKFHGATPEKARQYAIRG
ncbi:MAG: AraC family transcriptional regulator [Oscillospiraceae bacterium]|nr:AraC family transcriptional regulator [Oscillospiraceae bacterium]